MNVFLQEVRSMRKSTIIWMVAMAAMVALFMAGMYPGFTKDVAAAEKLISGLPAAVRAAFGISMKYFFTVFGFYAYFLSFATVAAAIQAMNAGVGVISKEYANKTSDFLMSKPVRRWKIIVAKLAAALASIALVAIAFGGVGYLAALSASKVHFSAGTFFLLSLTLFLVQLFFWALGAVFAVVIPKVKSVVSVSLPVVFTFFIIGTLGELVGNTEVRYLSPFKFFDPIYIIKHSALEPRYLLLDAAAVLVFLVAAIAIFVRKDIRAAA